MRPMTMRLFGAHRSRRGVRTGAGARIVLLLVGGIFMLVGGILTLVFCWTLPSELRLDFTAVRAPGRVVSAEVDRSYRINNRYATRVTVEYEAARATRRAEAITTDQEFLDRAVPGAAVEVEVLPSDPDVARVAGFTYGFFGHLGIFVLIFPGIGLALLVAGLLAGRRDAGDALPEGDPGSALAGVAGALRDPGPLPREGGPVLAGSGASTAEPPSRQPPPPPQAPPPPRPDPSLVPPTPREPSPRARRLVFAYAGGQQVMLILGVVFTLIGSIFAVAFGWSLPGELLLDLTAQRTHGTVVSAEVDPSYRINKRSATVVTVEYEVHRERHRAEAITIDREFLERAVPGASVEVDYAPSDPSLARVAGFSYSFFGHMGLAALIFPAFGIAFLFFAIRGNRREIRAFTYGDPVVARVTYAGYDTTTRKNNQHPLLVKWEFDRDGRTFTGSISSFNAADMADLMRAQEILVVHDRDDPAVNTVWVE